MLGIFNHFLPVISKLQKQDGLEISKIQQSNPTNLVKGQKHIRTGNKFKGESKLEIRIRKLLGNHYGYSFNNVRLDCLRNDETKRKLEIDMYCPELKLGVELHGNHHYNPNSHFFNKKAHLIPKMDQFKDQQRRDHLKAKLCKENGIKLVVVYDYEIKTEWLDVEVMNFLLKRIALGL